MIRKLAPHAALILAILGLAFLCAAAFTIGQTEIGTTLGLTATGLALLILEWRTTD